MRYRYIFAFDPSGNWNEGKGTTGWVLMDHKENLLERGYITAQQYECPEAYWQAHLDLIRKYNELYKGELIIVMEDYVLYRERSSEQTNSRMETCRLLGVLQWYCWKLKQPYSIQMASQVKHRWSDELLIREHILYRDRKDYRHTQSGLSLGLIHTRDAFRHALHYAVCRNQGPREYPKVKTYRKKRSYFMTDNYGGRDYDDENLRNY